jgi:lipoprotein-anchoring transpeptidase ErfK/SrfK
LNVPRSCANRFVNDLVVTLTYTKIMTARHSSVLFAAMAIATAGTTLAGTGLASAQTYQQGYRSQSPYASQPAPQYQGQYQQPQELAPDFDALDGPVMSPDDPRYGRPANFAYQGQPQGQPHGQIHGQSYGQPQNPAYAGQQGAAGYPRDDMRPPQAVNNGTTGAINPGQPTNLSILPPEEQPESGPANLPEHLRRQEVDYVTKEPPGTIVVDTSNTYLYFVLGNNRAMRYGVRVGREGSTWAGTQKVSRKAEWPDWHPPAEMIERQPYLPRFMAGGPGNPMGARAMYLGNTLYRIHGTNQPSTIGKYVSSGCIGMLNEDVMDLYDRVKSGTRVVVQPMSKSAPAVASNQSATPMSIAADETMRQDNRNMSGQMPGTSPASVPPLPAPVTVR